MEFDLKRLKGRPAYPFETIAVALAFSPRLEAVLAEAKRLSDTLHASLLLIHVGTKTPTKEERLEKMMRKLGMDLQKVRVIWMEGNPVNTILRLCKLNVVDLLIIGALHKENILEHYLGSVARSISRKAKCSVLLLTNPNTDPSKLRKVVVNGPDSAKTLHTINTALYLSGHFNVGEITVVNEVHLPELTMSVTDERTAPEATKMKREIVEEKEDRLESVLKNCKKGNVHIETKTIKGKPGYAISKYARDKKADLLIINSPDTNLTLLDRIFTHDMEYILADLPCNVLIVHSRVQDK
jgi:nucleotide-binding universal stress UspA family protein